MDTQPNIKRTALIVGASKGIGRATALALADTNTHIIALARTVKALESLDDAIVEKTGQNATLIPMDLYELEKIQALGPTLSERFEQIDIVIHAAATLQQFMPLHDIPEKQWHETMDLNVSAPFHILKSIHPLLVKSGAPIIHFLSDIDFDNAFKGSYGVSKAALEALSRIYSQENPDFKIGSYCPGITETGLMREGYPGREGDILSPEEAANIIVERIQQA